MATSTHGSRSSTFKYNEAVTAPGVTDDLAAGYSIGSLWVDTAADKMYVCTDTTNGAAVWVDCTAAAGGGAPTGAEYLVSAAHAGLSAERVATDTATVAWDAGTPAQIKANVPDGAITYAKIQDVSAASRVLGRGSAGGAGDTEELTLGIHLALTGTDLNTVEDPTTVYVPTTADTAINSVTDITIVTRNVTGVVAGDKLIVEAMFTILNNSGATRVYQITLDFDGLFDIEISTGALATSATLMHPFYVRACLDVRATNLCYEVVTVEGQLAAGIASGTDTTMAATHLRGMGWGTSASDVTGTTTVTLTIRSAAATATQTCRLHSFEIRKLKVTP